jgi:hypothetical protein
MSRESNDAFDAYAAREGYKPGTWDYLRTQRAWNAALAWAQTSGGLEPAPAPGVKEGRDAEASR